MTHNNLVASYISKDESEKIEVYYDESPFSPFEFTGVCEGHIAVWGEYTLGLDTTQNHATFFNPGDYSSFNELIIDNFGDNDVVLPLYLYDHSGITISTTPFQCPWDSGQLGFIYMTSEDIVNEFGVNTEETRKQARERMEKHVRYIDNYLVGNCYYFKEFRKEEYINTRTKRKVEDWEIVGIGGSFIGDIENNLKHEIEDFDPSHLVYS